MAIRGRPPGTPKSPRSGKQANHGPNTKKMSTAEMRAKIHDDLVAVYLELNKDNSWLLMIAREFPLEWLRQCWTRLAPALPRSEEATINNTVNVQLNSLSEIERARRVAFLLASAADKSGLPPAIEHQPVAREIPSNWRLPEPEPTPPVEIERHKAEELVKNTKECSIETYPGSSGEQGFKRRNLI